MFAHLRTVLVVMALLGMGNVTNAHQLLVSTGGAWEPRVIAVYSAERTLPAQPQPPVPGPPAWDHAFSGIFTTFPDGDQPGELHYAPNGDLLVYVRVRYQESGQYRYANTIQRYTPSGTFLGELLRDETMWAYFTVNPTSGNVFAMSEPSQGAEIREYDGVTGAFLRRFDPPANGLSHPGRAAFLPSGDLAVANDDGIRVYQGGTGYYMGLLVHRPMQLYGDFALDPLLNRIYIATDDSTVVYDFTGTKVGAFQTAPVNAYSFMLVPHDLLYGGALYVVAGGVLQCYDPITGTYLGGPTNFINCSRAILAQAASAEVGDAPRWPPTLAVASPSRKLQAALVSSLPRTALLSVYDVRGRSVHRTTLGTSALAYEWDPGDLAAGVYFVELILAGEKRTARWVRSR